MGLAIAYAAKAHGIKSAIFVSKGVEPSLIRKLNEFGADLRIVDGSYEDAVFASHEFASSRPAFVDANPGTRVGALALKAYREMAFQIIKNAPTEFQSVWVACGNGTTVAGLWSGFERSPNPPQLGAVGSLGNSALAASFSLGHLTNLDPTTLRETRVNRALVNWRALDGAKALKAVTRSKGWILESSDSELRDAARLLKRSESIDAHTCAAAALAGLITVQS